MVGFTSQWGPPTPRSRSEASVTLKSIASLIDQGSFVFSTLTIGRGLTHNVEQWDTLVKSQSARKSITYLTIRLPSPQDLGDWTCDLRHLATAYPCLDRLALTGINANITSFTHTTLTWLSISLPWFPHTSSLAEFPALEELVLLMGAQNDAVVYELQPFTLKKLKRLTIKHCQSTSIIHFMTCPSLNLLHLVDIRPGRTSDQVFADTIKEFLQRSQADRVTLRLTKDRDAAILHWLVLKKPHPIIHRLEIEDINHLLQSERFKKGETDIVPRTLKEIVMQRKPSNVVRGPNVSQILLVAVAEILFPRPSKVSGTPDPYIPSGLTASDFWKEWAVGVMHRYPPPPPQVVTVYIPDGRTAPALLKARAEERYGRATLLPRFPDVSQDTVSQMLWEIGGWIPYKDRVMYGT
ncbi:hypothetical protein BKA70DRAFT_396828 [Coprinopsis sp. MPI-PUGE-AT-0042]|nr:hypothetical protein BKA70DRAFT_396828 [Coprinopsis sp. MPI-PUGE-AT-0042]